MQLAKLECYLRQMTAKSPPCAPIVFYGAPINNGTELRFLANVRRRLMAEGVAAVILANFHLGPKKRQIDFVIATARQCVAVELKGYRRPVSGTENGDWKMTVGSVEHSVGFPYDQALSNRFAVSDALKEKIASVGDTRGAVSGLLCVYPEIPAGSSLPASNTKLHVGDFDTLAVLLRKDAQLPLPLSTWEVFARSMGLIPEADLAASVERSYIGDYLANCLELAELALGPHVEAEQETEDGPSPLPSLLPFVENSINIHLFGPSGVGKTHHISRLVIAAARAGVIPVAIAARDFNGQLLPLLKVAVARATNVPFNTLMRSAQKTGRTVLLCVDALNECPIGRRPELLAALQTVIIRFGVTLLLTGQELPDLPSSLRGKVFRLVQPGKDRRRRLVEAHAGRPLTENEASILEVVASAQDASILAETLNRSMNIDGRFQLYHAFTMGRLADVPNSASLHSALGDLAVRMREGYTPKISQHAAGRILGRAAKTNGTAQSLLDEAERATLLVNDQGAVRFRHDLIADFFASDHLLRTAENTSNLRQLIERPINAELREFVLGGATPTSETMALLDGDIGNAVIDAALNGRCGAAALRIMQDRCLDVIDKIEFSYCQLLFSLPLDGQELPSRSEFVLPAQFNLSVNEQRAAAALSTAIFTNLYEPVMKMLEKVDDHLWREARRLRLEQPELQRNIPALVFTGLYGGHGQPRGGELLRNLFSNIVNGRIMRGTPLGDTDVNSELDNFEQLSPGQLFLLLSMHRAQLDRNLPLPSRIVELIPAVWKTGIYHLRLQLLDLIHFAGRSAPDKQKEAVHEVLTGYLSENAWMNTILFDAINAVGELDFGISVESITAELKDIAEQPPSDEIAARACSAYTATYDHPADDVFCEAFYECVSPEVRAAVLVRVIAYHSIDSTTLGFAVRELGKAPSVEAIPYLMRLSDSPIIETHSTQSSVAVFCEAICQLARMGETLADSDELSRDSTLRVWQLVRPLIYAFNVTPTLANTEINRLWDTFCAAGDNVVMDVIYRIMGHSRYFIGDANVDFTTHCAEGLRSICLNALHPNYTTESLFKYEGGAELIGEHRRFAFSCLEQVARSSDKGLVESWLEDALFGENAVRTLRAIENR